MNNFADINFVICNFDALRFISIPELLYVPLIWSSRVSCTRNKIYRSEISISRYHTCAAVFNRDRIFEGRVERHIDKMPCL